MTTVLPRRAVIGQPDTIDGEAALVRIVTSHGPSHNDPDRCGWCGDRVPCHTERRQAAAQLGDAAKTLAYMTGRYLKRVKLGGTETIEELSARFFGWVEPAFAELRARERARQILTTSAKLAVSLIPTWFRNHNDSHLGSDTLGHHFRGKR